MNYKIISTGNVIVADVDFMERVHANDYEVVEPEISVVVDKYPISVLAFRSRFTDAEKVAIYTAKASSVEIQIWLDDLNAATDVLTDDPRTVAGVQGLEAAGLIAPGRAAEILA